MDGKSEPTAQPTVTEYVIRSGGQGVFSNSDRDVAALKLAQLKHDEIVNGGARKFTLAERTVTYDPIPEDHPQYDAANPLKVPTGEGGIMHPGTVKERKLA